MQIHGQLCFQKILQVNRKTPSARNVNAEDLKLFKQAAMYSYLALNEVQNQLWLTINFKESYILTIFSIPECEAFHLTSKGTVKPSSLFYSTNLCTESFIEIHFLRQFYLAFKRNQNILQLVRT